MAVHNQVQLITYPDSLGGDLKTLNRVLSAYFPDIFKGGVHILPPFPSSGDRGFAPLTYLEIDPHFGTWDDVKAIGENFDVLVDLMVNHISRSRSIFRIFSQKAENRSTLIFLLRWIRFGETENRYKRILKKCSCADRCRIRPIPSEKPARKKRCGRRLEKPIPPNKSIWI